MYKRTLVFARLMIGEVSASLSIASQEYHGKFNGINYKLAQLVFYSESNSLYNFKN